MLLEDLVSNSYTMRDFPLLSIERIFLFRKKNLRMKENFSTRCAQQFMGR